MDDGRSSSRTRAFLARFEANRAAKAIHAAQQPSPATTATSSDVELPSARPSPPATSRRGTARQRAQQRAQQRAEQSTQHTFHSVQSLDKIRELQEQLLVSERSSAMLREKCVALEERAREAEQARVELKQENEELAQVAMGSRPRAADEVLAEKLREKEDECAAAQTKYEQLFADSLSTEKEHAEVTDLHKSEMDDLGRKNEELQGVVTELHEQVAQYEKEAQRAMAEAAARNEQMRDEVQQLERSLAKAKGLQLHKALKHAVRDGKRKENKLRSIVVHVKAENKELKSQVDALLATHASIEARNLELEAQARSTRDRIETDDMGAGQSSQSVAVANAVSTAVTSPLTTLQAERSSLLGYAQGLERELQARSSDLGLSRLALHLRACPGTMSRQRALHSAWCRWWRVLQGSVASPNMPEPAVAAPTHRAVVVAEQGSTAVHSWADSLHNVRGGPMHEAHHAHLGREEIDHLSRSLLAASYTQQGVDLGALFARYDHNGDGTLSLEELHAVVERLVPGTVTEAQLRRLFAMIDRDHNGCIDYREFADFVAMRKRHHTEREMDAANGIAPKPTVPRFSHSRAPPAAPGRLNAALDDKHIAHFHSGTHRDRLLEEANAKAAATVARAVQSANRRFD